MPDFILRQALQAVRTVRLYHEQIARQHHFAVGVDHTCAGTVRKQGFVVADNIESSAADVPDTAGQYERVCVADIVTCAMCYPFLRPRARTWRVVSLLNACATRCASMPLLSVMLPTFRDALTAYCLPASAGRPCR